MLDPESIAANYRAVMARIDQASRRAGIDPAAVTLVAVSKTFPAAAVRAVLSAGASDIGENKVQECRDKKAEVESSARWHLIGHLQSNKARDAVRIFDLIQTVDRLALAEKLARAADAEHKRQEVLLEVNIGKEPQKAGADPAEVEALSRAVAKLGALSVRGLMAIPPVGDETATRRYFRQLRALHDTLGLQELSMGMTDDFEMAIEEGATIVRVGRAIFGSRT